MKIECPSCHLAGRFNERELPPEGRTLNCPRCKNSFHVAKPAEAERNRPMNTCPSCSYSTFTDETFEECPQCGMTAEAFQEKSSKQREREQLQHDQELLNRSYRNPDLATQSKETVPKEARAAGPVEVTGWICTAVGGALVCYGIIGVAKYYSKDWQAVLSAPLLEPVSKLYVFFSLGFIPWLVTSFGIYFSWAATQFMKLTAESHRRLTQSAWTGVAVSVIYETVQFVHWVRISSGTASFSYYAVGVFDSLLMSALLGAPFLVLLWYLETDTITRELKKAQSMAGHARGSDKNTNGVRVRTTT